jgi:hypothetical protein
MGVYTAIKVKFQSILKEGKRGREREKEKEREREREREKK